eukprot:g5899.t1
MVSRERPSMSPRSSIGVSAERAAEPARVPAIIDGQAVSWNELRDRTSEIGGAVALEEIALDRALARELERAGVTLAPDAISRERSLLLDELSASGAAAASADVLSIVRRQRSLGEVGFERLLERNARLRALVTPGVRVEEREVELAMRIRHGARKLARIIVTPSEREVAALRREILSAPDRLDAFTARAATRSIDASGARGGQIGSVSPDDPAFPDSLRQALAPLAPGQVSSVLAIDGGFAILIVEQELEPESTSAGRRGQRAGPVARVVVGGAGRGRVTQPPYRFVRGLWHAGLGPAAYACGITGALLQLTDRWERDTPAQITLALGATLVGALGMMLLDRVKWRDALIDPGDEAADPRRIAFLRPHLGRWRAVAALSALAGAVMAWPVGGPLGAIGVLLGYAAIGFYAGRPAGERPWALRIKDIPVCKNLFVALGLTGLSVTIVYGRDLSALRSPAVLAVIAFLVGVVACDAMLCDLPDMEPDRRFGVRTVPVLIGAKLSATLAIGVSAIGGGVLLLVEPVERDGAILLWVTALIGSAVAASLAPARVIKTIIDLRPLCVTLAVALLAIA